MEERFCHKPSDLESIYSNQSSENYETQLFIELPHAETEAKRDLLNQGQTAKTDLLIYGQSGNSSQKIKYCYLLFSMASQQLKRQQEIISIFAL